MTLVDDLRYPVGQFKPALVTTPEDRATHIEVLRELPDRLSEAVDGLDEAQIDTPYREGGWTVRQVVHHVADSHINSYVRFKLALTEDAPTIKAYDEAAWAALHARWVALLESMTEKDFRKTFVHPERGVLDLGTTLAIYAWHSRHHTAHITSLRERMGW